MISVLRSIALGLILIAGLATTSGSAELRLGSDIWPPFTDEAGRPRVAIDLVHEALNRADILGLAWIRADVDGDGVAELVGTGENVGSEGPKMDYDIAAGEGDKAVDRFFIEGEMYETWDDVPEKYKYQTPKDEKV